MKTAAIITFIVFISGVIYLGQRIVKYYSKKGMSNCCGAEAIEIYAMYDTDLEYTGFECTMCHKPCEIIE